MKQDNSVHLEQYFTKPHVARDSIEIIFEDLKSNFNIDVFKTPKIHFIEPACGEGIFVKELVKTNVNVKLTNLDLDHLYSSVIIGDFLKTDRKKLNIKKNEINIFYGSPPSFLTGEFLQQCKILDRQSKLYFVLEENKLKKCIDDQLIFFSSISILKNYGNNAFLFKNTNFTTQGSYLLTRIVF